MLSIDTIVTAAVSQQQGDLSKESAGSVWDDLRVSSVGHSREDWLYQVVRPVEDAYMEKYHAGDPKAKKSTGTWKYRTYMSNSWSSAKSVVAQGLEMQIDMGNLSKSQTEKAIKAANKALTQASRVPKTEVEKFDIVMGTAIKIFAKLTPQERATVVVDWGLNSSNINWS